MFLNSGRISLRANGSVRLRDQWSDAYDNRLGAEARIRLTKRFALTAGYLARAVKARSGDFDWNHRIIAGVRYTLLSQPSYRLAGSTTYERHLSVVGAPDFNRGRQAFEFDVPKWRISPWLYEDLTFRQGSGFVRSRARFGVSWRVGEKGYTVRAGYQWEEIKSAGQWKPYHALYTQLNIGR